MNVRCLLLVLIGSLPVVLSRAEPIASKVAPRSVVDVPANWSGDSILTRITISMLRTRALIVAWPLEGKDLTIATALELVKQEYDRRKLTPGPVQRLTFENGEAAWMEAQGATVPYLGAVARAGTIFLVRVVDEDRVASTNGGVKDGFLVVLRSLRPYRPEDERLSPAFNQVASSFLGLINQNLARRSMSDPSVPADKFAAEQQRTAALRQTVGDVHVWQKLKDYNEETGSLSPEMRESFSKMNARPTADFTADETAELAQARREIEACLAARTATPADSR